MALDALWAVLIPEESQVSKVQAPVYAGFADIPAGFPKVSEVSGNQDGEAGAAVIGGSDTPDTPQTDVRYQPEPAWALGCTLDTPDTCKTIDTEADAANQLLYGDLLTGWNVTIPHGTTAATLAKFRAASLALDASIVAAGGSLELPSE